MSHPCLSHPISLPSGGTSTTTSRRVALECPGWSAFMGRDLDHKRQREKVYRRNHPELIRAMHERTKAKRNKRCPDCGKLIEPDSQHCKSDRNRHLPRLRGDEAHAWKGGRWEGKDGRVRIYNPEHHCTDKDRYVFEHILVWEIANRRLLPEGWVIHHLNGVPSDNRPSNLVALQDRKHRNILGAKAKRIQELEAQLKSQGLLI
jgi:hypothetical protein